MVILFFTKLKQKNLQTIQFFQKLKNTYLNKKQFINILEIVINFFNLTFAINEPFLNVI